MKKLMNRKFLSAAFFIAAMVLIYFVKVNGCFNTLEITLMPLKHEAQFQVFYNIGRGFNETDSIRQNVQISDDVETIRFKTNMISPSSLRIDPGGETGLVVIKEISLKMSIFYIYKWKAEEISKLFLPNKDMASYAVVDDLLHIQISGKDPMMVHDDLNEVYHNTRIVLKVFLGIAAFYYHYVSIFI